MVIMFGHYPIGPQEAVKDIVRRGSGRDNGRYGVFYDEMSSLRDDEDWFDAGLGGEPTPPIAEFLKCHIPLYEIELDQDDSSLKQKVRKTRIKGDAKAKPVYGEEEDPEYLERIEQEKRPNQSPGKENKRTFTINQASYNMVRPGYTVVLYGPRRSGKSKLIKNLCQRTRHIFNEVVVFTMTKASGEYFGYIPYGRVIEGLDEDLLEKLIDHQMDLNARRSRGEDVGNTNMLIIIDDCMAEGLRFRKKFNQLFYNGRHSNITLFVAVQDVRGIAPSATQNADLVCTFSLPDSRGRDTIREKFADYLTDTEFDNLYDSEDINKKYHVVFFDIAHRYNPLDKRISFGCVDPDQERPFVMGPKQMWDDPEGRQQLIDLGFEHLLNLDDWGIIKPDYIDPRAKKPQKNARSKK